MNKHIIYLAAGNSRRFGSNKLMYIYEGKPLFRHGLDMLTDFCHNRPDCSLTVVSQYPEILEQAKAGGARTVYSPDSPKGMSYTIKAAIRALPNLREEDFILFVVADQPYLTRHTLEKILSYAGPGIQTVSAAYGEIPGNPVLFSAQLVPELMELQGDEGGRKVLRKHECVFVEVENKSELFDIDTPLCYDNIVGKNDEE